MCFWIKRKAATQARKKEANVKEGCLYHCSFIYLDILIFTVRVISIIFRLQNLVHIDYPLLHFNK